MSQDLTGLIPDTNHSFLSAKYKAFLRAPDRCQGEPPGLSGPAEPMREYPKDTDNPYWMPHSEVTALARHPNSARFHKILEELGELHDKKQADYGRGDDPFANVRASTEWGVPAWVGAMIRLNDKVRRLQSLALKGKLANESAEDSLRDIAVYAIIALVLREEEVVK